MLVAVLILAIIEGLTEFLPISSTGHLVVAAGLLDFRPEWREPFLVVIQLGAIFAIVVLRWKEIAGLFTGGMKRLFDIGVKLALGFVPSAALGFIFHHKISELLKNPKGVSIAWIVGGIIILALDRKAAAPSPTDTDPLDTVTPKQALLVGLCQCLALWPGMSRSGSTIIGGLAVGLDRRAATLFSFYLAIPTMLAASGYELLKNKDKLSGSGTAFALGMVVSFLVAWATVRWLVKFVQSHTFRGFAIYRIVAGALLLLVPAEWLSE